MVERSRESCRGGRFLPSSSTPTDRECPGHDRSLSWKLTKSPLANVRPRMYHNWCQKQCVWIYVNVKTGEASFMSCLEATVKPKGGMGT